MQWPTSSLYSDPMEGIGGQDSDTIDSYSDDSVYSDISVHTSPEIGKAQVIDTESVSELDDRGTCQPHSLLTDKSLQREERADSAELKGRRWKARLLKMQTSTPVCARVLSEVYIFSMHLKVTFVDFITTS